MASSRYISHGLNLTDNQLEKIIRASQNKQGVVVRINKDNLNGNLHKIPLTKTQINRITKSKNGLNLFLSSSQLKYLKKIWGSFTATGIIAADLRWSSERPGVWQAGWLLQYHLPKMLVLPLLRLQKWSVHNREIESQLKSGANAADNSSGAGVSNSDVVGNGIISDAASRIPVVGPFIVPLLKRLGFGLADINTIN